MQSVWAQTLDEVDAGFLIGPFELAEIPTHVPLRKKIGVSGKALK